MRGTFDSLKAALLGGVLAVTCSVAPAQATQPLPAGLRLENSEQGQVLARADGAAIYRLDLDRVAKRRKVVDGFALPRCADICERLWKPVAPPKTFKPDEVWGVVQRKQGAQLTYKGDPLYTFEGESLEEAAKLRIAPSYYSSYSAKPTLLVDGVPLATVYWKPVVYEVTAPAKTAAPPGVKPRWFKTAFVLTDAESRRLYTSTSGKTCQQSCEGLEPFKAPLAASAVGEWRPMLSESGDRYWSYRGRVVYGAKTAEPESGWTPIVAH